MNLDLSDEQRMLGESLRRMLGDLSPPKVVRQMEHDPQGCPAALWAAMAEMGLPGLVIDEQYGGVGAGAIETTIVYEELGRALAPTPHFVSAILAAGLIARAGSDAQKRRWLPAIASGKAVLAPAWLEPGGGFGAAGVQLRGVASGDGIRLSGRKWLVPFASMAERLLVLVRSGAAAEAIDIVLVDPQAPGVVLTQHKTMASDAQYEIAFDDVVVPAADRLGAPGVTGAGWGHWQAVLQDGRIALAAWAVGCADRAVELTTDYAKERVQFGRPIGGFQGVAHPIAYAASLVAASRLLAQEAAWARDCGRPHARLATMAHLQAAETARQATKTGHQVFGGIGFTNDLDMQLYYRRAKQHQLAWGDVRSLEEAVGADVLGETVAS